MFFQKRHNNQVFKTMQKRRSDVQKFPTEILTFKNKHFLKYSHIKLQNVSLNISFKTVATIDFSKLCGNDSFDVQEFTNEFVKFKNKCILKHSNPNCKNANIIFFKKFAAIYSLKLWGSDGSDVQALST